MKKHYKIRIYGRVQRVGFRFTTVQKAYLFNLKGFVRNKSDGSILIEAEGEEEDLQKLIDWCKIGPTGCVIDNVEIEEGVLKNYASFEVVRRRSKKES